MLRLLFLNRTNEFVFSGVARSMAANYSVQRRFFATALHVEHVFANDVGLSSITSSHRSRRLGEDSGDLPDSNTTLLQNENGLHEKASHAKTDDIYSV
jgi:hypothetical protein